MNMSSCLLSHYPFKKIDINIVLCILGFIKCNIFVLD